MGAAEVVEVVGDGAADVFGGVAVEGVRDGEGWSRGGRGWWGPARGEARPGAFAGEAAHMLVGVGGPGEDGGEGAVEVGGEEGADGELGGEARGEVGEEGEAGVEGGGV
ncbi:MAG: hypothetical protein U0232_04450 [Thermomicrobiales bacterium]